MSNFRRKMRHTLQQYEESNGCPKCGSIELDNAVGALVRRCKDCGYVEGYFSFMIRQNAARVKKSAKKAARV